MILAIDLGSTNFKGALFLSGKGRIAEGSRPLPYTIWTNTRAELDPKAVAECFFGLMDDILSKAGVGRADVRRVSMTSQATTFCVCDAAGCAQGPMISWTDRRDEEEAAFLRARIGAGFHAHSGWPELGVGHMLSKALWWKRHEGLAPDQHIVSLPSFLGMQLGAGHVSDANLAAMSGFYSIPARTWWAAALEATGISAGQLGDIVQPGVAIPTCGDRRPAEFSSALEVVYAGNDHTSGAVGCGCRAGLSILTLGTAGVLYQWAGEESGPFGATSLWGPYPRGGYYELVHISQACSALDWADETLSGKVDSPRFAELAARAQPTMEAPLFNPSAWGTEAAWSRQGAREEMAYATFEGIALALRDVAGDYEPDPNQKFVTLGGGSRLDFFMQITSDIFQTPMTRATADGLDGAASLAGFPGLSNPEHTSKKVFRPHVDMRPFFESRLKAWRAFARP